MFEIDFDSQGFEWVDCNDHESSVISFLRRGKTPNDELVVVCNFTPVPREEYRIGVPQPGFYSEVLNSDAGIYGGTNIGNLGGVYSEPVESHGHEQCIRLHLPPLSVVVVKPLSTPNGRELP